MNKDIEFIKYDTLADGKLLKWLQNNLSTDNRLYISIFLNKEQNQAAATNGFSAVFANLKEYEYKNLFGDRNGAYEIEEIGEYFAVISKSNNTPPAWDKLFVKGNKKYSEDISSFDSKLITAMVEPFDSFALYNLRDKVFLVVLNDALKRMPYGEYFGVIGEPYTFDKDKTGEVIEKILSSFNA